MSAPSRRRIRFAAVLVVALLTGGGWLPHAAALQQTQPAGAPATGPAAQPAAGESMKVVIVEVVGAVQVSPDGKTWKPAKVNMELNEGASFRTGIRSSVTCIIPPDQTFKLESLGTVRVAEAVKTGSKVKTDLIMKYGATSYGIEAAGAEHDATIRTPSSTLAVRGTVVRVFDQPPFAPRAESFTGQAFYRTARRETRLGGNAYAAVSSVQGTAADTALSESVVDPATARARSNAESRFIANQVSLGATASFDETAGIPVVRGGAGPHADEGLASSLPGRLSFALRWTGNADLNLLATNQAVTQNDINFGKSNIDAFIEEENAKETTNPKLVKPADLTDIEFGQFGIIRSSIIGKGYQPQEILFPGFGLNRALSGGSIPFDHRGGANGGQEIAFWQDSFPLGVYGVSVLHNAGASSDFKINAFLDGQPVRMTSIQLEFDSSGNIVVDENGIPVTKIVRFNTFRGTVDPKGVDSAILFVPGNRLFDQRGEDIDPDTNPLIQQLTARALASINAAGGRMGKASAGPTGTSPAALAGPRTAEQNAAAMAKAPQAVKPAKGRPAAAVKPAATGASQGERRAARADGGVKFNKREAVARPK